MKKEITVADVMGDYSNEHHKGMFYFNESEAKLITSLKGSPKTVSGSFICTGCQLRTLEGAPKLVGIYFDCSDNELTSLEGAPKSVGGTFYCDEYLLNGENLYIIANALLNGWKSEGEDEEEDEIFKEKALEILTKYFAQS